MARQRRTFGPTLALLLAALASATAAGAAAGGSDVRTPHRAGATNTGPAEDSEAATRDMRQAAIRIQQRLRAEHKARETAQRDEAKNERCIGGQRMKRVDNGWVDAGRC